MLYFQRKTEVEQISSHKRYLFRKPRRKNSQYLDKLHYPESKLFRYCCKLNKTPLSILHLTEKIKNTYHIERSIATENNKIAFHYEKCEPLLPLNGSL